MMGPHHAASGAAIWLAVTTQLDVRLGALSRLLPGAPEYVSIGMGLLDFTPVAVIAGAIVTAGAALVPDADHWLDRLCGNCCASGHVAH